jgi:penicillin amidase
MRADRVAPLVYTVWMDEFTRLVLGRRVGPAHLGALYGRRTFRSAVEKILLEPDVGAKWCASSECIAELNESLARAVAKLSGNRGGSLQDWHWGPVHAVEKLDPISILLGEHIEQKGFEVGGDPSTVNMTHYELGSGKTKYPTRVGANARFIYDLADANSSWFVQFGGPDELENASSRRFTRDWQYGHFSELRFEPRRWGDTITLLPNR